VETDATQPGMSGPHPTMAELRDPSVPHIHEHLSSCSMCRSVVAAAGDDDAPIPLELPKGLVSEDAFRWPGDPIARGGMAQIFAGDDKRLGRAVILKAPRDDDGLAPGMVEMFQHRVTAEARVLAKLQHPSIVTIYELGKSTVGWPFCVLEHVDGVSLRDKLDELAELEADGKPRTRERVELLSNLVSIAEALAYAHERRVVHRDVTPNNILLGKRGEATLIDWGIARDLDAPGMTPQEPTLSPLEASMSGKMVTISAGTPPYMPLEQSQGRRADPSFDVYSFGITLYETVSGRTPFQWQTARSAGGKTAQVDAFIAWLQSEDPVTPAMPRDRELSGIIARAMTKDPATRFTSDELVRALKQYLTGDLVFSHRYSLTGRLARWAGRHRAITVSAMFLVAGAIAGALAWAQISRQAREEADLRALASAAQTSASEKGRAADEANRDAESAKQRAEEAERQGKDSLQLKQEADRKRRAADAMRQQAEAAAVESKGTADEALKRFEQAMRDKEDAEKSRDEANKSAQQSEHERDQAHSSQVAAEKERDAARAGREAADKDRDAARATAAAAEADREAARTSREAAEKERDAARASQLAVEKERDAANTAKVLLEKKLAELEAQPKPKEPVTAPAP
jgi:tRNA A-37 threonylcarbamoyl transferase component Bud32